MADAMRTSGCFCGAVEVEIEGDPAVQAFCHCSSCRGWLGAPIHAAALLPTDERERAEGRRPARHLQEDRDQPPTVLHVAAAARC